MPTKITDISGQKFNRLTAIRYSHRDKHQYWVFQCSCGEYKTLNLSHVKHDKIKSCGCLKLKHSLSSSREYKIWVGIKQRCNNKNSSQYKYYGKKNIKICDEWNISFDKFITDMGFPPSDKHTVDRIDGSKGYEKNNCRWATRSEQSRNIPKISVKCTSIYKGVSWEKRRNRWVCYIYSDVGKQKYIGSFDTQEEAALAYNEAAKKYFCDFACLNKI